MNEYRLKLATSGNGNSTVPQAAAVAGGGDPGHIERLSSEFADATRTLLVELERPGDFCVCRLRRLRELLDHWVELLEALPLPADVCQMPRALAKLYCDDLELLSSYAAREFRVAAYRVAQYMLATFGIVVPISRGHSSAR